MPFLQRGRTALRPAEISFALLAVLLALGLAWPGVTAVKDALGRSGWLLVLGFAYVGLMLRRAGWSVRLQALAGCAIFYTGLACGETLNGRLPGPWLGQNLLPPLEAGPSPWGAMVAASLGLGLGLPLWGGCGWPELLESWGAGIESALGQVLGLTGRHPAKAFNQAAAVPAADAPRPKPPVAQRREPHVAPPPSITPVQAPRRAPEFAAATPAHLPKPRSAPASAADKLAAVTPVLAPNHAPASQPVNQPQITDHPWLADKLSQHQRHYQRHSHPRSGIQARHPAPDAASAAQKQDGKHSADELEVIDLSWIKSNLTKHYRKTLEQIQPKAEEPSALMDEDEVRRRVQDIHAGRRPAAHLPDTSSAQINDAPRPTGPGWTSPVLLEQIHRARSQENTLDLPSTARSDSPPLVLPKPTAPQPVGKLTSTLYGPWRSGRMAPAQPGPSEAPSSDATRTAHADRPAAVTPTQPLERPPAVAPIRPDTGNAFSAAIAPVDGATAAMFQALSNQDLEIETIDLPPVTGTPWLDELRIKPEAGVELPLREEIDLDDAYEPAPRQPTVTPLAAGVPPISSQPIPDAVFTSQGENRALFTPPLPPKPRFDSEHYDLPLSLLQPPDPDQPDQSTIHHEELERQGQLIQEKLAEFRVNVTVQDACAGPVITRYEVEPAVGVRGAQVVNLMKDLARALRVTSIRVVETIPGKTYMGLELPNPRRQMIRLSEVLCSDAFQHHGSKLALALGKDIIGKPVVMDLSKAPHLLVAGTTGSGKSVGVNGMILSLLFRATPDEVRFVMIDPKMLELSVYDGIPHLLAPVVTDMKLAANALNWCVGEMERRYRLMSALGVRNLAGYNHKVNHAISHGRPITDPFSITPDAPAALTPLPFIVVVVDEFADLMMVAGKKIEELIARLAQKARAAGIHLILATQRPSVDVITGLIKANIPTRVAFQVSSKVDSRTILDQMGAETLLGQGDMLYLPPGTGYPQRVHGAFVADEEVHAIVEHLKQYGEPDYVDAVLGETSEGEGEAAEGNSAEEADPLYDEAVAIVINTRRASISLVQRQLRIGYNRAARLVEAMEQAGVVSPMESNGNRTVLVPER